MEKYLQRLQTIFQKPEILPRDARDGMLAAYVVVSCINQARGNPGVGLTQEAEGIFNHIQGFTSAVFWERGFDFNNPTIDQLSEIKIMIDGITQTYAMPENFQNALNDVLDCLFQRGRGQSKDLAQETKILLQIEAGDFDEVPAAGTPGLDAPGMEKATPVMEQTDGVPEFPILEQYHEPESNTPVPAGQETAEWEHSDLPGETTAAALEIADEVNPASSKIPSREKHSWFETPLFGDPGESQPAPASESFPETAPEPEAAIPQESISPLAPAPEEPALVTDTWESEISALSAPLENIENEEKAPSADAWETPVPAPGHEIAPPVAVPAKAGSVQPMGGEFDLQWKTEDLVVSDIAPPVAAESGAGGGAAPAPGPKRRGRKPGSKSTKPRVVKPRAPKIPKSKTGISKAGAMNPDLNAPIPEKKKRGRKKKVDENGVPVKTKRIRRIDAKSLKIDLSTIEVPEDYMRNKNLPPSAPPANVDWKAPDFTESPFPEESAPGIPEKTGESLPVEEVADSENQFNLSQWMESPQPATETRDQNEEKFSVEDLAPQVEESRVFPDVSVVPQEPTPETEGSENSMTPTPNQDDDALLFGTFPDPASSPTERVEEPSAVENETAMPNSGFEQPLVAWENFGPKTEAEQWAEGAPEAVAEGEPAVIPQATPTRVFSYSDQLEQQPEPQSSPSDWTELNQPAGVAAETEETAQASTNYEGMNIMENETMQATSSTPPPRRGSWLLPALLGLILGAGLCYGWFEFVQFRNLKSVVATLQEQIKVANQNMETAKQETESAQQKMRELKQTVEKLHEGAKKAPEKPQYVKVGSGVMLYWVEKNAVRPYFVYQTKGAKGQSQKITEKAIAENFYLLKKVPTGAVEFRISGQDMDGMETGKSEPLSLKFPLKK